MVEYNHYKVNKSSLTVNTVLLVSCGPTKYRKQQKMDEDADLLRKSSLGIFPGATAMARTMHRPVASGVSVIPVLSSYS